MPAQFDKRVMQAVWWTSWGVFQNEDGWLVPGRHVNTLLEDRELKVLLRTSAVPAACLIEPLKAI